MKSPEEIVQLMLENDAFSQFLGIKLVEIGLGNCTVQMTIREEMLNGFHIAHGGISYSLADSAFAFAANTHGFQCVSIESSISHVRKVTMGDCLIAVAKEKFRGKKTGIYEVVVQNERKELLALFKGHVHVSEMAW
jgi:acyl-CoA thioesterase